MYTVETDGPAQHQVDALPAEALAAYTELRVVLETAPWSGRPYHRDNPQGAVRARSFGTHGYGGVPHLGRSAAGGRAARSVGGLTSRAGGSPWAGLEVGDEVAVLVGLRLQATVLNAAGLATREHGHPNDGLKMLQFGLVKAWDIPRDEQRAVVVGESGRAAVEACADAAQPARRIRWPVNNRLRADGVRRRDAATLTARSRV